LIEHWETLAAVIRATGGWEEHHRLLAFDLLGIRPELRTGTILVPALDDTVGLTTLVENQLESLRNWEIITAEQNEAERDLVLMGFPLKEDAESARLRRAEMRARNELAKARAELSRFRAEGTHALGSRQEEGDRPVLSEAGVDDPVKQSEKGPSWSARRWLRLAKR
jgi:hypothetical protein